MAKVQHLKYLAALTEIGESFRSVLSPSEMTSAAIAHATLVAAEARDPAKDYEGFVSAMAKWFEDGLRDSVHLLDLKTGKTAS